MSLQQTTEWRDRRRGKWTGTAFADIMSKGRGNAPSATRANCIMRIALERLTGNTEDTYQSEAMKRGIELEPFARQAYEAHTGAIVTLEEFADHPTIPNVGVSVDAIVSDTKGAEYKCPLAKTHLEYLRSDQILVDYKWQLVGQIWVKGWNELDAVSYHPEFPEYAQLSIKTMYRDESLIDQLATEVAKAEMEVQSIINEILNMKEAT